MARILVSMTDNFLKTNNDKVFAYSLTNDKEELIVLGSLDDKENQTAQIKSLFIKPDYLFSQCSGLSHPKIDKEALRVNLSPLELQVYIFTKTNSNQADSQQ